MIQLSNNSTGENKYIVDFSLQIRIYDDRFRAYIIDVWEYDIILGINWHQYDKLIINGDNLSIIISDQKNDVNYTIYLIQKSSNLDAISYKN